MRQAASSLLSWLAKTVSSVISFVFGAFRKMPVRVGLAIVGSICLTIAFALGLLWGYIAPSLLSDNLQQTAQNSLSVVLAMILIWISIATFIPSAERQTSTHQAAPKNEEESVVEIREAESAASVDDDEPELVE
jgi:hypothetical protein|tara:strand:+ start:306 stop:707 length:402 start_codon:yes stop_codon:yes gene_type:complete